MKDKPLPGAKLRKQRLNSLQLAISKGRIDLSMHKLKTYEDILKFFGLATIEGITFATDKDLSIAEYNVVVIAIENKLRDKLAAEATAERNKLNNITSTPNAPEQTTTEGVSNGDGRRDTSVPSSNDSSDAASSSLDIGTHAKHPLDRPDLKEKWMPECPNQKAILFPHQAKAAKDIMWKLFVENKRAVLLRAPVGSGKTFIFGEVDAWLWNHKPKPWFIGKTFSPIPSLTVTKASIVEQTTRVAENLFGLDPIRQVSTLHYDALRSSVGERMIENIRIVEDEEPRLDWKWIPGLNPLMFKFDECQSAKNEKSQQSQITQKVSLIEDPNVKCIFSSATPFTRVSEAKYFVVNAKIPYDLTGGIGDAARDTGRYVTEETWPLWSRMIAFPADPEEHCEAAVERLMQALDPYVVDVKNVRSQFKAVNKIVMIDFMTAEEQRYYNEAYMRYMENCSKIESSGSGNSKFLMLVEWLKFRQAAEMCRKTWLAEQMYNGVQKGFAGVAAMCFKQSMAAVVKTLVEKYKVRRNDISMIWGGSADFVSKGNPKYSVDDIQSIMAAMVKGDTIDGRILKEVKKQLLLQAEGLGDISPDLRLGPQDYRQRQEEIDRFQGGRSLYCLFNFKSGGVGLSLHHSDDMLPDEKKVRRKDGSGYAYVEDIPSIPTRPRVCYLTPTYSAIELVQGLGRCPRITSLSDTIQNLVFYRGTIEEKVAAIVSLKLKCLSKVVRCKEDWSDVILDYSKSGDTTPAPKIPDEEAIDGSDLFNLDTGGDEEDNEE